MEQKRFRFAHLPDGLYVAEFSSPNDPLPSAGSEARPGYSVVLARHDGILEGGESNQQSHTAFSAGECATYEDAFEAFSDHVAGSGGEILQHLFTPIDGENRAHGVG